MTRPKRNTSGDPDSRPKKTPISLKRKQARSRAPASSVHDEPSVTGGEDDDLAERPPSPASSSSSSSSSSTSSGGGSSSWSSEAPRSESTAASSAGNATSWCSLDRGAAAAAAEDASSDTNTTPPSSPTPMKWRVTQRADRSSQSVLADRDDGGCGAGHGGAGDAGGKGRALGAENFHHRSHDANAGDDDGNGQNGREHVSQCDESCGEGHNGTRHPTVGGLRLKIGPSPTPLPAVQTTSIQSLPSEILLQIGEKLFERDLDRFSRTSRRMYILLTQTLYRMGKEIEFLDGSTVLHWGAIHGLANTVAHLLEQGANPNAKFQRASHPLQSDGRTPLHIAAEKGHRLIAKLLLGEGAKTKVWDRDGDTPLHLAVKNGHIKVVKLLVNAGAKITARNADGLRPLHVAVQEEQRNVIKLLIAMGADVMATDRTGGTALHLAASFYTDGICKRLIDAGANVNAKDRAGMTPLHWAAYTGFEPVARLLVRCGSKVDERDDDGKLPWHWAGIGDNKEAFAYLQKLADKIGGDHTDSAGELPTLKSVRLATAAAPAEPLPPPDTAEGPDSDEE